MDAGQLVARARAPGPDGRGTASRARASPGPSSTGSSAGWRAMRPMLEVSPLSPLRPQAICGSAAPRARACGDGAGCRSQPVRARHAVARGGAVPRARRRRLAERRRDCGCTCTFGSSQANCRRTGDTEGRPPAPVVPGDHEVPAGGELAAEHLQRAPVARASPSGAARLRASAAPARMRAVSGLGAEQSRSFVARSPRDRVLAQQPAAALEHRLAGALCLGGGIDADDGQLRGHLEALHVRGADLVVVGRRAAARAGHEHAIRACLASSAPGGSRRSRPAAGRRPDRRSRTAAARRRWPARRARRSPAGLVTTKLPSSRHSTIG